MTNKIPTMKDSQEIKIKGLLIQNISPSVTVVKPVKKWIIACLPLFKVSPFHQKVKPGVNSNITILSFNYRPPKLVVLYKLFIYIYDEPGLTRMNKNGDHPIDDFHQQLPISSLK